MKPFDTLPENLRAHIDVTETCWLWTGHQNGWGYGGAYLHGKIHRAHRLVYTLLVGDIPAGLQIDHLCRVRHCVNPDHLEPVTPAENNRRSPLIVTTINASKTDCAYGHPLSGTNLRLQDGRRQCAACGRRRMALCRARRKALRVAA